MDRGKELGRFLAARRANASVDWHRLPMSGGRRRVPGLRRDEVAWLAGISTTYYTKLEHGTVKGISDSVLDGLAVALRLTPQECAYVASLISVSGRSAPAGGEGPDDVVGEPLQRILDAASELPIHVLNERCDIVATNTTGRALYPFHFEGSDRPNAVRFLFLDPRARSFFVDWELWATQGVAYLRASSARDPGDVQLRNVVRELSEQSHEFESAWASHDVQFDLVGTRRIDHPDVGRLDLDFQGLLVVGQRRLRLTAYSARPGSATARRLARLVPRNGPTAGEGSGDRLDDSRDAPGRP